MALSTRSNPRPVLGATRARQGRFGQHVFWVLVFGTLLATLGLFAAWALRADRPNSTAAVTGPAAYAPEPAPINPQPGRTNRAPPP